MDGLFKWNFNCLFSIVYDGITGDILYLVLAPCVYLCSTMRHSFYALLFFLFLAQSNHSIAQVYVSPREYKANMQHYIELKTLKDVLFMQKNIKDFYGVQCIRMDGAVDISECTKIIERLDDVEQVELISFQGQLLNEDLERLDWAGDVLVYVKNGDEQHILNTPYLEKLAFITLVFEVVPEDFNFLKKWRCRSLKLIAPFVKKEVPMAINACAQMRNLRDLGISLDRVQDLPPSISSIKRLKTLAIIDNLSWLTQKYLSNLSLHSFNIEQSINQGEFTKYTQIEYYADEPNLTDYENNYILSLFTDGIYVPFMNQFADSSEYAGFATYVPLSSPESTLFPSLFKKPHLLPKYKETEFYFNATNQKDFVYYIGEEAALFIPKNSLRSSTDSVHMGTYTLRVSWSNKPRQFFAQSNTLNFDSSQKTYQLAPSAVIELQAMDGQNKLEMRPGYFWKIVFAGSIDSADRFYAFNGVKNTWENFWDYDYEFDDIKNQVIDFYQFYGGDKIAKPISTFNRLSPMQHFETQGFSYHLSYDQNRLKLQEEGPFFLPRNAEVTNKSEFSIRRGRKYVGISRISENKIENVISLRLYDKTSVLFPELKAFKNVPFYIQTKMDRKTFSKTFISKKRYNDVRIESIGSEYYLDLKLENAYWHLKIAQPNSLEEAKISQAKFAKAIGKYQECRTKRLNAWQTRMLNQEEEVTNKSINTLLKSRGELATAAFRIRSMGAFAYAHPTINSDTFSVIIQPTNAGGIPIEAQRFVVANRVPFTYQVFGAQSTYSVELNYENLLYIACADEKGQVYTVTGREFNAMGVKNNTYIQLPMNALPQPIGDSKDLDKRLNIKK